MFTGVSDTAGTPRSFTIDGFEFNTTYYFAAKAMDMWNNNSVMSNVPTDVTLFAPVATLSVDSLHCVSMPDTSFTENILLSNTSAQNSTLDYSIALTTALFRIMFR